MTKQDFYDTFNKIYANDKGEVYVSGASHPIIMLGEALGNSERSVMGMGITPDTLVGIQPTQSGKIYLRDTQSELLSEYSINEANPQEEGYREYIFRLLRRICDKFNITGGNILLHNDCGDYGYSATAVILNLFGIFSPGADFRKILDYSSSAPDFCDNARRVIMLEGKRDSCVFLSGGGIMHLPFKLDGFKIVVACTDKELKKPNLQDILKKDENELLFIDNSADYAKTLFVRNERERIKKGADCLTHGNLKGFGAIVKSSSLEYMKLCQKSSDMLWELFSVIEGRTWLCGIYESKGIFAVVEDENVDQFINEAGGAYEKRAGKKPEFYICAPSCGIPTQLMRENNG